MAERRRGTLSLRALCAGPGLVTVLEDLSLAFAPGETVAILGRNGVGKTTLLETVMGLCPASSGSVELDGLPIRSWPTWRRARAGLALVPQEREVFPSLSVVENLEVAAHGGEWTRQRAFDLFPRLAERQHHRGNELSGGEQQMLAIARALMGSPSVLLLDEPLEGLAPIIVQSLLHSLRRLREESGMTMLLVEQHAEIALGFAERAVVLVRGRVAFDGRSSDLAGDPALMGRLLGVSGG
jgi:branched-chain amino acid transport system ATP-binding protein